MLYNYDIFIFCYNYLHSNTFEGNAKLDFILYMLLMTLIIRNSKVELKKKVMIDCSSVSCKTPLVLFTPHFQILNSGGDPRVKEGSLTVDL